MKYQCLSISPDGIGLGGFEGFCFVGGFRVFEVSLDETSVDEPERLLRAWVWVLAAGFRFGVFSFVVWNMEGFLDDSRCLLTASGYFLLVVRFLGCALPTLRHLWTSPMGIELGFVWSVSVFVVSKIVGSLGFLVPSETVHTRRHPACAQGSLSMLARSRPVTGNSAHLVCCYKTTVIHAHRVNFSLRAPAFLGTRRRHSKIKAMHVRCKDTT